MAWTANDMQGLLTPSASYSRHHDSEPDLSRGCSQAPRLCGIGTILGLFASEAFLWQGGCRNGWEPPCDVHVQPQHNAAEYKNHRHEGLHVLGDQLHSGALI